ncbi:hypothetical protein HY218_01860 [Candidatus Saccharibacteria bacterium]|nr:hypothetical protein [Candidatus Saccharibacteria bacterium]
MDDPETRCPSFDIGEGQGSEVERAVEALRTLEHTIYVEPVSMLDSLTIYEARLKPANANKSIEELKTSIKTVTSSTEAITASYDLWVEYNNLGLYRYLKGFDPQTELEIDDNRDMADLVVELRNYQNRNKAATQEKIRVKAMSIFIGRVITSKCREDTLEEELDPSAA